MRYQPLDTLSILTMYLLTVLLFFVAIEVGYRVNRRFRLRSPDKSDVSLGGTVGASMALVAFLVALVVSFGMGISAERRHLMVAEANPILLGLYAWPCLPCSWRVYTAAIARNAITLLPSSWS